MKALGFLFFCLVIFKVSLNAAIIDPHLKFRVIKTAHFWVYYHQGEEKLARKAASIAEEVHTNITRELNWEPKGRTHLGLLDSVDLANGFMLPVPYNTIVIFPTAPSGEGQLGDYEDWLRNVITHEYTHVVHIDMVYGFPMLVRHIFGRSFTGGFLVFPAFPNMLGTPDWMIEGLATYEETEQTSAGRGRSSFFDMMLRCATLDGKLNTLDQAANGTTTWPGRTIAYLYGESFYRFLANHYSAEKVAEFQRTNASRTFPYFALDTSSYLFLRPSPQTRTFRKVFGNDQATLYADWRNELNQKYQSQLEKIRQYNVTVSTPLTHRGYEIGGPVFSPDGQWIAYIDHNPDTYPALRIVRYDGSKDKILKRTRISKGISWSPDGQKIAYAALDYFCNFNVYSDLYVYDLKQKKTRRLTRGQRFREPAWSPDGSKLIFVANQGGRCNLATCDTVDPKKTVQYLTHNEEQIQYARPTWSPDGEKIAVSIWKPGGYQDIQILSKDGTLIKAVTEDRFLDLSPTWSSDGESVYFSSDRSGVFNIYAYSVKEVRLMRVTNVVGGAFSPSLSADGKLAFVNYSSKGFDIHAIDLASTALRSPETYADWHPAMVPLPKPTDQPSQRYNPGFTLLPRFWLPDLQGGIITGGNDLLQRHSYLIDVAHPTDHSRLTYDFNYLNDRWTPTLFFNKQKEGEKTNSFSAKASYPFSKLSYSHFLTLGYEEKNTNLNFFSSDELADIPPSFQSHSRSLSAQWDFDNTKIYSFSVAAEEGRLLTVGYTDSKDTSGASNRTNKTYTLGWTEYCRVPLHTNYRPLNHQVLALSVTSEKSDDIVFTHKSKDRALKMVQSRSLFSNRANRKTPLNARYRINMASLPLWSKPLTIAPKQAESKTRFGSELILGNLNYFFPIKYIESGKKPSGIIFFDRIYGQAFLSTAGIGNRITSHSFESIAGVAFLIRTNFAYLPVQNIPDLSGVIGLEFTRRIDKRDKWEIMPFLFLPLLLFY